MKRNIVYMTLCLVIAFMTSSCMGVSGGDMLPDGMPSDGVRLTDVGNPDETEELMKTYINPEFEVKVQYPGDWDLEEIGTERAEFTSVKGEDLSAVFMWLDKGDTLESFLTDVRGDISDLNEIVETPFDRTLCAPNEESGDDMLAMECYHYYEFEKGSFVASISGLISKVSLGVKAEPFGIKVDYEKLAKAALGLPQPEPMTPGDVDSHVTEVEFAGGPVVRKPVVTAPTVLLRPESFVAPFMVIGE